MQSPSAVGWDGTAGAANTRIVKILPVPRLEREPYEGFSSSEADTQGDFKRQRLIQPSPPALKGPTRGRPWYKLLLTPPFNTTASLVNKLHTYLIF